MMQHKIITMEESSSQQSNNDTDISQVPHSSGMTQKLSKNQEKKHKRREFLIIAKQKKKEEQKKRKHGELEEPSSNQPVSEITYKPPQHIINELTKNERKLQRAEENAAKCAKNFSIIIDCAWEDKHTEATLRSLTQQIMFCQGINRKHDCPAALYLTGVGPLVDANLAKNNYKNWLGVQSFTEDYTELSDFVINIDQTTSQENKKKQLVYLTSDAEETLDTLDPNCAYIIGGIVDRNKHKFATYNKAKAQGIRTAKLPIKENFALAATHILTVNHVYNILLNYAKYQDWVQAIKEVMPSRKVPVEKDHQVEVEVGKEGESSSVADAGSTATTSAVPAAAISVTASATAAADTVEIV